MKLLPDESDNWSDFDLRETLVRNLAENRMSAQDLLCALIETLVFNYRDQRMAYPGEMPPLLLQGVELLLRQQQQDNEALCEQEAGEDAPPDSEFVEGMIFGQRAARQAVLADLLCDCMKALGARPIRKAA